MRIIYISHSTNYYGANKQLVELILCLRKKYAVEPYVICRAECEFTKVLSENDISYFVYPFYIWVSENRKRNFKDWIKQILNKIIFYPLILKKIPQSFELVHTNTSITNLGVYISRKMGIPHIWHVREYGLEDYGLRYILKSKYVKEEFERASAIIAISNSIKEYYSRNVCPKGKFSLIYDGIRQFGCKEKDAVFFGQDILKFCCVGLIQENKNQFEILEAAKKLLERRVKNFRIYFIGSGRTEYIKKMTAFVKANKLEEYIVFTGKQENVGQLLSEMHVGITPSKQEAFGRVTVEYMYAGMPVICNGCGANRELVGQNTTGLFYTLYDSGKLAELMQLLIENRELAWKLGKNGKKRAEESFMIDVTAEKTFKLYQEILAGDSK